MANFILNKHDWIIDGETLASKTKPGLSFQL